MKDKILEYLKKEITRVETPSKTVEYDDDWQTYDYFQVSTLQETIVFINSLSTFTVEPLFKYIVNQIKSIKEDTTVSYNNNQSEIDDTCVSTLEQINSFVKTLSHKNSKTLK